MRNPVSYLLICAWTLLPALLTAQFYPVQNRPPGLNWQQLKTDHFRIIFPKGADSLAYRSARILEQQYPKVSKITGGYLKNFPVILNNYNDRSNGFVTTFNFRSEVELPPSKGKEINPQSGSWLEAVLPHELIHAAHSNVYDWFSLPGFVGLFSPDFSRSVNAFAPVGLHEGLAVYHETEFVTPKGGRGNYTHFNNRFTSNFHSSSRWNMGQTLIPSEYTLPYGRHYISGYTFIDWLHENYGEAVSQEAIRFHYLHFFLGYGAALKRTTGKWPNELYHEYVNDLEQAEEKRLSHISNSTTGQSPRISPPYEGQQLRSPKWLSEDRVLFYGSFYNSPPGFYVYDPSCDFPEYIQEAYAVGDYHYEITKDRKLLYSRFQADLKYPETFKSDIHLLDLDTGENTSLSQNDRLYSPTALSSGILALQTDGASARIVQISREGDLTVIKEFEDATPVSVKANPSNPEQIAIIINRRGVQALWITSQSKLSSGLDNPPDLAFKSASVFDAEWHPSEARLLFTLDAYPAMNVYEYNLETDKILQVTSSRFNAFEASYAPSGDKIAYVLQSGDERKIATLQRGFFSNKPLPDSLLLSGDLLRGEMSRPFLGHELMRRKSSWAKTSYASDFSWLKPRLLLPFANERRPDVYEWGVTLAGVDALSSQSYTAQFSQLEKRTWFNVSYYNRTFFPGINAGVYSRPSYVPVWNHSTSQPLTLMKEDRGLRSSVPLSYTFRGDTRLTSLHVEPGLSLNQARFYDLRLNPLSGYATQLNGSLFTEFNYRVQQLPRDVQPSSGFSLFASLDRPVFSGNNTINYPRQNLSTEVSLKEQWAAYYGIRGFTRLGRNSNNNLRIGLRFLHQKEDPSYSTGTIIPMGFTENPFPSFIGPGAVNNNLARLSTRFTFPLLYPDSGWLTVPLYASSVYISAFSHTLTNLNASDLLASSRSIYGMGFHVQFKLSNLSFDVGIGLALELSRLETQLIFGQF